MFGFGRKKEKRIDALKEEEKQLQKETEAKKKEVAESEKRLKKEHEEIKKEEIRMKKEEERKKKEFERAQLEEKKRVEKEMREKKIREKKAKEEEKKRKIEEEKELKKEREEALKKELEEKKADEERFNSLSENAKKQEQNASYKRLKKNLIYMAAYKDPKSMEKLIKMKPNNVIELDNKIYRISSEHKKDLLKLVEKQSVQFEIYNTLRKYKGERCNIMVSNGEISQYFDERFKNIDSTRWKLFYVEISDSYKEMAQYKNIKKNLYATRMRKLSFEQGKFRYLKSLEKIDVLLVGGDIAIPSDNTLVATNDGKITITNEFIKRHVTKTFVVPIENKVKSSISGAETITSKTNLTPSFWQVLMSKIV